MIHDTDKEYCRIIFDTLTAQGVRTIVSSPGSRNLPLLLAANARSKRLRNIMIADERTASFVALGIAIATKTPVALCCTSGTAMLNYAPAAAEAFYQGVPLILITADRPVQWIDQDDSQTIRQFNALSNITKASFDIPAPVVETNENIWYVRRMVADAVLQAGSPKPGPVHLNVQIDAPLGNTVEYKELKLRNAIISNCEDIAPSKELISDIAIRMAGKKVLIVSGFISDGEMLSKPLKQLVKLPNIEVLAENISNINLDYESSAIDSVFAITDAEEKESLKPDIVISIGGALISRMLKEYLRRYSPEQHWHIGFNDNLVDCFKCITANIHTSPLHFFNMLAEELTSERYSCHKDLYDYHADWSRMRRKMEVRRASFMNEAGWSELYVYKTIIQNTPANYDFYFSNGTPIRYAQLFAQTPGRQCYCNRGVSGIEGTNATAAGMAVARNGNIVLITGDLSFSYDTGILGLKVLPPDFKIIVINNNGGGIFRFVKQSRTLDCREDFFSAVNAIPIEGLVKAYNRNYILADNQAEFAEKLKEFFNTPKALMEIKIDVEKSADILYRYLNTY